MSVHRMQSMLLGIAMAVAFCTLLLIVQLTWFDFRGPPINISYTHPVPVRGYVTRRDEIVEAPVVAAGGSAWLYREYCVDRKYSVLRSERWLINVDNPAIAIPLPLIPVRAVRDIGKCIKRSTLNTIPEGVPPGRYMYRVEWTYMLDVNPIATFRYQWQDVLIEVR